MFDFIAQILGSILAFFYELLTPAFSGGWGYGLSIIALTITINILVFPLTLKQTRSTRAFAAIQPKIKKIQAEFKDDPQEMQRRLMALQKEAGATPGGCLLPMLVQMPIWFALFTLLRDPTRFIDSITALGMELASGVDELFLGLELSTSPSQALSEGGLVTALPYLLLMAAMVVTQYVQQWHSMYGQERPTGQPGAGATQAITKIMPLFIGFISYGFPAGLGLYWATSNLFRLGQQVLIFKIDGRPPSPGSASEDDGKPTAETDEPRESKPQPGAADKRRRRRRK
ncbi:MAG: YidC/Oxa1 family membrane protein insertase [Acidimicrobiia bacterium]